LIKLNIIQNKAIKIINKKSIYSSLSDIDTEIINLAERFNYLNLKYLTNALVNNNELITELWSNYQSYTTSRATSHPTILCKYKDSIKL
jgi:hypothetical protein